MERPQPSCTEVIGKASLEILGFVLLILPMAYIYVFTKQFEPYHRGFFCDDENLKHPYIEHQTVPIVSCVAIWASVSVIFIVIVETLRVYAEKNDQRNPRKNKPIRNNRTPWIAVELYRHFGYFALGALTTLLFTELAKYQIGRLRPHYLTLCNPKLTEERCKDQGYYKFVVENEETLCQNYEQNKKELHEARLSFLSGHSSFSFYCGTFLIIYLQARLNKMPYIQRTPIRLCYRVLKVLRPFIQFAMIILSFWVSLTRISDYFHHPMDVVTGALVGVVFALVTLTIIADLFNKRSSFWKSFPSCDPSNNRSHHTNTATEVALTEK